MLGSQYRNFLSPGPLCVQTANFEPYSLPQMRWGCDPLAGAKGRPRNVPPPGPPPPRGPSGLHPPFGAPPPRMPLFPSAAEWNANFTAPPPKVPDASAAPNPEPDVVQPEVANTNEEIMFPRGKTAELQLFLEKTPDKTLIGKLNY